jgi:hypothetical protein
MRRAAAVGAIGACCVTHAAVLAIVGSVIAGWAAGLAIAVIVVVVTTARDGSEIHADHR